MFLNLDLDLENDSDMTNIELTQLSQSLLPAKKRELPIFMLLCVFSLIINIPFVEF